MTDDGSTDYRKHVQRIKHLYVEKRLSIKAIADTTGFPWTAVRRTLRAEGVAIRGSRDPVDIYQQTNDGVPPDILDLLPILHTRGPRTVVQLMKATGREQRDTLTRIGYLQLCGYIEPSDTQRPGRVVITDAGRDAISGNATGNTPKDGDSTL